MEIIDRSPYPLKEGKMSFMDRMRGSLEYGFSWYAELQAQESIITSMSRLLGNDYVAMHRVTLPETDITIPLMAVGPTGLYILYVTPLAGVYRAKGENWLIQESGRGMRNARPNLLARTQLMGRAVEVYLKRNGCNVTVQTALLCSSPKMFVESVRPSTRVILSDAIEKFISSWGQDSASLGAEEVRHITDLLTNPPKPVEPVAAEPAVIENQPAVPPLESKSVKKRSSIEAAFGKVNFTSRQWIMIGVLVALLVCLLVAFIAIVLITLH
jgi:hypothetical protein